MHPHPHQDPSCGLAAQIRLKKYGAVLLCLTFGIIATFMIMESHGERSAWHLFGSGLAFAISAVVMIVAICALDGHGSIVETLMTTIRLQRDIRDDVRALRGDVGELRSEVAQAREESAGVSERLTVAKQHLGDRLDHVAHRTREQTGLIRVLADQAGNGGNVYRIDGGHDDHDEPPPGGAPR